MIFKKFLALSLALATLLSLAACGEKSLKAFNEKPTTETTVLSAQDESAITIDPVEYVDGNVELNVHYETSASDARTVSLVAISVNGVTMHVPFLAESEAGESISQKISIPQNDLRLRGIFGLSTIDLLFTIADETSTITDTLSTQIKTSAAKRYKTDDKAYLQIVTGKKTQKELGYTVVNSITEQPTALGYDVSLKSQVFVNAGDNEYLLLEVANEGDAMRYVQIGTSSVNGMFTDGAIENCTILPGTKAVFALDMNAALPAAVRDAFGMDGIATVELSCDVYGYTENGEIDWDESGEYTDFTYNNPERSVTMDLSGTEIYNKHGLKISAKSPVEQVVGDEVKETYVYLIIENTGNVGYTVLPKSGGETVVGGDSNFLYFDNPGFIGEGDIVISHLMAENMTGQQVIMPLYLQPNNGAEGILRIKLEIPF